MSRTVRSVALGFLSLILLLVVLHAAWEWTASRRLVGVLREQARQGLPMSLRDIVLPAVSDEDNAAIPLQEAFLSMRERTGDYIPPVRTLLQYPLPRRPDAPAPGPPTRATEEEAIALLGSPPLVRIYALLEEAASRPASRFPLDYTLGSRRWLPHLSHLRNAVRLVLVRGWLRATEDPAGAIGDVARALRLADAVSEEPVMVSQLVRMAMDIECATVLRSMLERLELAQLPSGALLALQEQLRARAQAYPAAYAAALDGERILIGRQTFDRVLREGIGTDLFNTLRQPVLWLRWARSPIGLAVVRPLLKSDFHLYLVTMAEYRDQAKAHCLKGTGDTRRMVSPGYPLTFHLLPALEAAQARYAETLSWLRLAETALALALYAQEHGYPDRLEVLGAAERLPRDPCSGRPFVYRRLGQGYLLYAVGADGRDDGGRVPTRERSPADLVWRIGL